VPSIMSLLGRHAWYLPRWLDRFLPQLRLEGGEAAAAAEQAHPAHAR
jgi:putative drug exporter of the RND superfamily